MIMNIILIVSIIAAGHSAIVLAAESRTTHPQNTPSRMSPYQQNNERAVREKEGNSKFECDARRNPDVECKEFLEQRKKQKN
jgi:hypothetical protein